jgi:RNA polymerase sigma factor (sigma-70 family)
VVAGCTLNVVLMWKPGIRPARGEIDQTALSLLARHGAQILATARRYAATPEDAEDAYQRGLEILLTKAPTTSEEELVPWLKTVVKHETYALRRQRDRHSPVTDDGELGDRPTPPAITHDQAERYERLRQGAEALRQLKPQEIRALLLKAEGYSYREICEITGWTYTKVNRCLTEGRQALAVKLAGIKGGAECERFVPLLSALADGEATAEELALLRPHMKTCLTCRARLKEFRAAPARVAAVAPAALLAADDGGGGARGFLESVAGAVQQKAEAVSGAAQHKAAAFGERLHAASELATGQKLAAVAASAAALAGGGAAVEQVANQPDPPRPPAVERPETKPVKEEIAIDPAPAPVESEPPTQPAAEPAPEPAPAPAPEPAPTPAPPPPPPPDPANEFAPGGAAPAAPPATPRPQTSAGAFSPGGGGSGGGGGGAGEFAP